MSTAVSTDLSALGLNFDKWQDAVEAAIATDRLSVVGEVRGGQLIQYTDPSGAQLNILAVEPFATFAGFESVTRTYAHITPLNDVVALADVVDPRGNAIASLTVNLAQEPLLVDDPGLEWQELSVTALGLAVDSYESTEAYLALHPGAVVGALTSAGADAVASGSATTPDASAEFSGRVLEADCVFYATGRRPMLDNLGLENVEVKLDTRGYIEVDDLFQTATPSVLAIGDVIGRVQLTPVALAEGMAVARRLFKPEEYRPLDYRMIPTAVFSLPNIGTVGLSEEQAVEEGYQVKVFESRFRPMKLTLTENPERTLMKLVVDAATDRVLGCHMVGPEAGEIIQGLAVALKAGASKRVFDETLGIHPTAAEEFVTLRTPSR